MMEALFLKIVNMSITATYVLLAILILRLLLKRAPKSISFALWNVLLFRLVCPISFSSVFSLFNHFDAPAAVNGGIEYIPSDIGLMNTPQVNVGIKSVGEAVNNALPQAAEAARAA